MSRLQQGSASISFKRLCILAGQLKCFSHLFVILLPTKRQQRLFLPLCAFTTDIECLPTRPVSDLAPRSDSSVAKVRLWS
jgi:hypothetical protein